jgi:hypothetical protein
MISMAVIGVAQLLRIMVRLAAIGGAIWMVLFYTAAAIRHENNPFPGRSRGRVHHPAWPRIRAAGRYLGLGRW